MSWEDRIIADEDLRSYLADSPDRSLSAQVWALLKQQKATWPMLREGYEALAAAETKAVDVDGSNILIQHNARRIRSTAAVVDPETIRKRPCFLCEADLPAEEKAIAYGTDLLIMCNPFPVLDGHLSIVHRNHVEQRAEPYLESLLALAYGLSPRFFTLYNGPHCGASAPDHFHLQACAMDRLPIEEALGRVDDSTVERCSICESSPRQEFELFTLADAGRTAVVFRGNDRLQICDWIRQITAELPAGLPGAEAMINIVCRYDGGRWTVFLFPRSRHRPDCFYANGDKQILVSPGAIDMAGVIVLPRRDDFLKVGPVDIASIFAEVSISEESVNEIIESFCSSTQGAEWSS